MLPYRDSRITRIALILFFLIIAGYAYFEARGILFGPSIAVSQGIERVSNPYIDITGTTTHIASLEMNGESVPVTEQGAFEVPYVLAPGENRVVLDAEDKYGHATQKVLEIVYTPAATSSEPAAAATSTPMSAAISTSGASTSATSTGQ